MAKVISLSEEAYKEMREAKRKDESFSDVALRLLHETKQIPISTYFGIFKDDKKEWLKIKNILVEDRKKFKIGEVNL